MGVIPALWFRQGSEFSRVAPQVMVQQKQEMASPYFKVRVAAVFRHYNAQIKSFSLRQLGMDGNSSIMLTKRPIMGWSFAATRGSDQSLQRARMRLARSKQRSAPRVPCKCQWMWMFM